MTVKKVSQFLAFVIAEDSTTLRIEWAAKMAVGVVKSAHDFDLIPTRLDVINIDGLIGLATNVALSDGAVERVSPVAAPQMANNFAVAINRLEAPHRQLLLQGQED